MLRLFQTPNPRVAAAPQQHGASRIYERHSDTATPRADVQDVLTFEVMVTLEDQLALHMCCLATPAMQAGRLRREAVMVLIGALCAPFVFAGGVVAAWVGDGMRRHLARCFTPWSLMSPTTWSRPCW